MVASETLFINRKDGFAGYGLKKDEAIEKCSDLDDVLVIGKNGVMKVMKIADKMFVGKIQYELPFFVEMTKKSTIWFIVMVHLEDYMQKKFKIGGITRDKEYPPFKVHSKSRIFYFAVHDSEKKNSRILVHIDPDLKRVRDKVIEF